MMQSILQSSNTPIRIPVVNTFHRAIVSPNMDVATHILKDDSAKLGVQRNMTKTSVNRSLFRESMFVRVIPTRPCASCNGAR